MNRELSIALITAGATATGVIIASLVGLFTKLTESSQELKKERFAILKEKIEEILKKDEFVELTGKVVTLQAKLESAGYLANDDLIPLSTCTYSLRPYYPYLSKGLRMVLTDILRIIEYEKDKTSTQGKKTQKFKITEGLRGFLGVVISRFRHFFEVIWWGKAYECKFNTRVVNRLSKELWVFYGRFG